MEAGSWFSEWFNSPYYHLLYSHRDEKEAKEFIERLLLHLHPPIGARMLDVGCGRGRHSRQLAAHGFTVTGLDVAPANIQFASQYSTPTLRFQVHDMRHPFCEGCMDYVVNFFTSFGYFETWDEHESAVHTMALALTKGGKFVLDYVNSKWAVQHLVPKEERTIRSVKFEILRWSDNNHLYKKINVWDEKNNISLSFTEQVATFSLQQLQQLIEKQHLKILEVVGDYQLRPFHSTASPRLLLIAQKEI
jgi:SAM-dependent methyltransferase